jgi:hypothetical protein
MMRLLRPPHIGIFPRSFRLHGIHHAREMIVEICSMWGALVTAIITRTGSKVLDYWREPAAVRPAVIANRMASSTEMSRGSMRSRGR